MEKVIAACAEAGCALEINAHPFRLDLDWRLVKPARDRGVRLSIAPDAHSESELQFNAFGVDIARKGWAVAGDVLNCLSADDFLAHAARKRRRS
jgi:DNA polymerase (family 10)